MIYGGRRNESGAQFRAGECALFTESSAGYAGVKAEAEFPFAVVNLPYWDNVEGAPVWVPGPSLLERSTSLGHPDAGITAPARGLCLVRVFI